jgi:anthranilate phosphoribosyltransferase
LINVSTATAFVAAAVGLPIAKHGNRSVSSRCGSADVLEALGARIDLPPEPARAVLDETGFCFLFAPAYHPGMKHAALVRRQLSVRTIMNLLGPCINPARPPVQLLGVADPRMLRRIAETLDAMGVTQALVVHGSGLDEVALHGETLAVRLSHGEISQFVMSPEDAGIERAPLSVVAGGDPAENARRLQNLLEGTASKAETDITILNAAALLQTAGKAATLKDAADLARGVLESGKAARVLDAYIEASRG